METSVMNVAQYILEKHGRMTTMKLEKLVYYAQAWSLVWDEEPLFKEEIQAWMNGPVVPKLFQAHKGSLYIDSSADLGDSSQLSDDQRETIDVVLQSYGHMTGAQLSELTHDEQPWADARSGLSSLERGNETISLDAMMDFYTTCYIEQNR